MTFKPNYRQQRVERDRLKQEKKEARLRELEQAAARRKAQSQTATPSGPRTSRAVRDQLLAFENRIQVMKRRAASNFILFDVIYADGSRRSNRKVPSSIVEESGGEKAVSAAIEAQDREIALVSGWPREAIRSLVRSQT
jgi:hypothetical protein